MGPIWPKMRQHGPKGSLTWPRKAPRSGQDGQVGAKMEPTWPQDGPRRTNMRKVAQDGPIERQHRAKLETRWSQHRAKVGPRWPSWSQDGPREHQDRAKMAKLEPRWSQHGSKMAKDEPTWADIGTQHGLRLRITAPVQQIRPTQGGGSRS